MWNGVRTGDYPSTRIPEESRLSADSWKRQYHCPFRGSENIPARSPPPALLLAETFSDETTFWFVLYCFDAPIAPSDHSPWNWRQNQVNSPHRENSGSPHTSGMDLGHVDKPSCARSEYSHMASLSGKIHFPGGSPDFRVDCVTGHFFRGDFNRAAVSPFRRSLQRHRDREQLAAASLRGPSQRGIMGLGCHDTSSRSTPTGICSATIAAGRHQPERRGDSGLRHQPGAGSNRGNFRRG